MLAKSTKLPSPAVGRKMASSARLVRGPALTQGVIGAVWVSLIGNGEEGCAQSAAAAGADPTRLARTSVEVSAVGSTRLLRPISTRRARNAGRGGETLTGR